MGHCSDVIGVSACVDWGVCIARHESAPSDDPRDVARNTIAHNCARASGGRPTSVSIAQTATGDAPSWKSLPFHFHSIFFRSTRGHVAIVLAAYYVL